MTNTNSKATETQAPAAEVTGILRFPTFTAVRVVAGRWEFVGHFTETGGRVTVYKIEMSEKQGKDWFHSFVGYAEGEAFERLSYSLARAAERVLRLRGELSAEGPTRRW